MSVQRESQAAAGPSTAPVLSTNHRHVIESQLRRVPEQKRSWNRVENVLLAAEEILEEDGYDFLVSGLAALLERARVPVGTFYDYFESMDVVIECLRLLWTQRIYEAVDDAYESPCASWEEVSDRLVNATVEFFGSPATRDLWLAHQMTSSARRAELVANQATGARIRYEVERLGFRFVGESIDELVVVEVSDQLARFAFFLSDSDIPDPDALDRAKRVTRAYLWTLIAPA